MRVDGIFGRRSWELTRAGARLLLSEEVALFTGEEKTVFLVVE
jgi:hypothetical protein